MDELNEAIKLVGELRDRVERAEREKLARISILVRLAQRVA